MTSRPIRTRAESLAADIEDQVAVGRLQPGAMFSTLDELRARTGFARSTVSEAVRLLSDRGVLEIRSGRGGGLFVSTPSLVVRMRHALLTVRDDDDRAVADAVAVREALELLVDVEAARHRQARDIDDLRAGLQALVDAREFEPWLRANWALHERIAQITPNTLLQATYLGATRFIADASEHVSGDRIVERTDYLAERVAVHAELVEAIAAGDVARTTAAAERHNRVI